MLQPESTNQKLGALRSDISITLHSRLGTMLWNGRSPVYENGKTVRSGITSMPKALKLLTQIQRDAENDDPFADYYLLNFERMVISHREKMQSLMSEIMDRYAVDIPEGIDISRCENVTPVTYQILSNSQLGFKLIYLLNDFDMYARTVATAQHIALITRREAMELSDKGAALLRKCFGVVETYRHSGVTRQDAAENNARYKDALVRFHLGSLPQEILTGELRAEFAPVIRYPSSVKPKSESEQEKIDGDVAENKATDTVSESFVEIKEVQQEV